MKKVLITGASGFIGRECLSLLTDLNYEVYALTSKTPSFFLENVQWIKFDLLKDFSIDDLLKKIKPSHLLHLAWVTTPGKLWEAKENLDWLELSTHLIEAFARNGGKRAVLAGTCAEYDWTAEEFSEEKTACRPSTFYGYSKLNLFLRLQSLAKQTGLSQAWGRVFYLYGPHEHPQRFVPSMINGILQQKLIPCSHGNQIKDYLHVYDVSSAFVKILTSDIQGAINIGSGFGVSLREIINEITSKLGGENLIQYGTFSPLSSDPHSLIANASRLQNEIKWAPTYTLKKGLYQTIDWWKRSAYIPKKVQESAKT